MSLINDALKRVSEAERGKPPTVQPDFETRAMQPTMHEKRPAHLLWFSVALLIGAVGVGYYVFPKSKSPIPESVKRQPAKVAPESQSLVGKPTKTDAGEPKIVAPQASVPAAQPEPEPVAVPASPTFRLKAILYTKNPTALINEASVQAGGEVDGATVTSIESTSVTLDYEGKTIVLKLKPRQ
jgi:hypothetical protein